MALIVLITSDPPEIDRVEQLGAKIKCPVCQGESILDSPAQMAQDMMDVVEERVATGVSDEVIIDELLSSYSGALLLDPPAQGSTLFLWLAPLVALGAGVGVILFWRRHPAGEPSTEDSGVSTINRRVVGSLILGLAFIGIVVTAVVLIRDDRGPREGVANIDEQDLSQVSNETLEAVIAANLDNAQINGMRLALAERYYEAGDYRSAFPHYLAVAEAPNSSGDEAVAALVRLGFMAWTGNGEVDAALGLLDEALAIDGSSPGALFLKGEVLWCGLEDFDGAALVFGQLLNVPDLEDDSRRTVESSLTSVTNGENCT